MTTSQLHADAAALRAAVAAFSARLTAQAPSMPTEELFELAGDLQGVANAVEGAQLVAVAHASSVETRLTERGPLDVRHEVGFVDAMASSEVSLATGVGQWAASRKVGLASSLAGRFPRLLALVVAGQLATANAYKVVTACDGLDQPACAAVENVLADRLVGMDPARITTLARRIATRVAAGQVAAAAAKNKRDRCVQVSPGPDGTTDWWARLPAGRSAAAWAAISDLGDSYAAKDESLTLDQARADAFLDLVLTNVTVTARVTLGIPVLTGAQAAKDAATTQQATESGGDSQDGPPEPGRTGQVHAAAEARSGAGVAGQGSTASTPGVPAAGVDDPVGERPVTATGGLGLGGGFSLSAALLSGCEMPGIGFIDADTVETLLAVVPTDIGRALLDARTGTLMESVSAAYRPPAAVAEFVTTRDGTCRMWGCTRAARRCDLDHARPWPAGQTTPTNLGGLCRRHHRLKQRRRWAYTLAPDGTATWTSPTGRTRTTPSDHAALPPPPGSPPQAVPPGQAPEQPYGAPERELATVEPPPF